MTKVRKKLNQLKTILTQEQTQILNAALLAMLPVLFTKLTGQLFYLLAASYFGTEDPGWQQFLVASTIPDFISNVLIAGIIGGVVIPTLITVLQKEGFERFTEVLSTVTNFVVISLGLVAFLFILLPQELFAILYPELSVSESAEILNMMRLLLIPQVILAFSVSISNALNIYHRYLVPQIAPLLFNIGKILFLAGFFYVNSLIVAGGGDSQIEFAKYAVIAGVYFGSMLHLAIQIPLAWKLGIKFRPVLKFRDKYIRELSLVSIPRIFALVAEHLALAVNKFVSFNISGGIAALNYANSLSLVIPQLFAFTFAYASFPKLSEHFNSGHFKEIRLIINKTLNEMIFLALPFIITIIILRVPIVRLSYGILPDTRLTFEGTYQIAWVLLLFSLGHIFVLGKWFFQRAFYAAKDTLTPFLAAVVSLILTVGLAQVFTYIFSYNSFYSFSGTSLSAVDFSQLGPSPAAVGGIAIAMSVAYTIEFFFLFILFHKRRVNLGLKVLLLDIGKKLTAGLAMFVVMFGIYKTWGVVSEASIESYNRGSELLNLVLMAPFTLVIMFFSYKVIWSLVGQFNSKFVYAINLTLLLMPIIIYILQLSESSITFGLLYGIFAMMVSYMIYLIFYLFVVTGFIYAYRLIQKYLPKKYMGYIRVFFTLLFVQVSVSLIGISSRFIDFRITKGLLTSTTLNLILITLITVVTSFLVYYLVCLFLKVEELRILKRYLNPIFKIGGLKI